MLCLALLLVIVFLQVVFRYLFQVSVPFTEEAARYLGVWLVFTGGAALVASDGHIRLSFLVDLARGTPRTALLAGRDQGEHARCHHPARVDREPGDEGQQANRAAAWGEAALLRRAVSRARS